MGDQISNDGKLTKTIAAIYSKAIGVTSQIINMLKEVSLGYHFFIMAMVFRNLKFINSVLINAEVWHSVVEDDLKDLRIQLSNYLTFSLRESSQTRSDSCNISNLCKSAQVCMNLLEIARFCVSLLEYVRVCLSLRKFA